MTAEVAVMNQHAVALAADSAVTAQAEHGAKIFPSANKIFGLSGDHPIGIMIYGSAELLGMPWETIVKLYRDHLGRRTFPTTASYVDDFLAFLLRDKRLCPAEAQHEYGRSLIQSYFSAIRSEIEVDAREYIESHGSITESAFRALVANNIRYHRDSLTALPRLPHLPSKFDQTINRKYATDIANLRTEIFHQIPLTSAASRMLRTLASNAFTRWFSLFPDTGIVFAGFGDREVFPQLISLRIEGIVENQIKYAEALTGDIDRDNKAAIYPFAQHEMVNSFMEGVDPGYNVIVEGIIREILDEYPRIVIDTIAEIPDTERARLKRRFRDVSNRRFRELTDGLESLRNTEYAWPIVSVVAMLPKDELAAMAEALVNLTSFKRKVSPQAETVGGPVDVAVISKGDGFIWIKRKFYFRSDLNPHFFARFRRQEVPSNAEAT